MESDLTNGISRFADRSHAFCVDGMLGRLAKWLRILGFDAEYPCASPSGGRIFVTMRQIGVRSAVGVHRAGTESAELRSGLLPSAGIRVTSVKTMHQLRQILDDAGIRPDPRLFLSRCLVCNVSVGCVGPDEVIGRVPDRVLELTKDFTRCPQCGRVYWMGTHQLRMWRKLEEEGIVLE